MSGKLLSDMEIKEAIKNGLLGVSGLDPCQIDLEAKKSPIQPGSLDLTVGNVYEPPEHSFIVSELDESEPPSLPGTKLPPGHSLVVETKETLTLSRQISAFGFPPAHLARESLLMTNPGHVDPGYHGKLTFTVINLGREEIYIREGIPIVTLMIFEFDKDDVSFDYSQRKSDDQAAVDKAHGAHGANSKMAKLLNKLSPDFGNFSERMSVAAQNVIDREYVKLEFAKLWVPAFSGVIAIVLTYLVSQYANLSDYVKEDELTGNMTTVSESLGNLEQRLIALETTKGISELTGELDVLRAEVEALEERRSNEWLFPINFFFHRLKGDE